jgi:transcriptional regulator with XRE-family HTH domain
VARTPAFKKRIGNALKARRDTLKWSQEEAAEAVGKHRVNYWQIENGKIDVRASTLERLALGLKLRPWELLKLADEITSTTLAAKKS